jgi:hypothetical protein
MPTEIVAAQPSMATFGASARSSSSTTFAASTSVSGSTTQNSSPP